MSSDRQRSQINEIMPHAYASSLQREKKGKQNISINYGFKSHTPMMHALSWCFVMDSNLNHSADLTIKCIIAFRIKMQPFASNKGYLTQQVLDRLAIKEQKRRCKYCQQQQHHNHIVLSTEMTKTTHR